PEAQPQPYACPVLKKFLHRDYRGMKELLRDAPALGLRSSGSRISRGDAPKAETATTDFRGIRQIPFILY
ncbi:MAG: hypothetical protein MUF06_15225, partial [Pirellulaceae bacterium]|nr:hypothetical protein [Pirellulaceae bacterium]